MSQRKKLKMASSNIVYPAYMYGYRGSDRQTSDDEDEAELKNYDSVVQKYLQPAQAVPACGPHEDMEIDGAVSPVSASAAATTSVAAATTTTKPSEGSKSPKDSSPSGEQPVSKAKRKDVDALITLMNKPRKTQISAERRKQIEQLPEEAIDELREEVFFGQLNRENHRLERRRRRHYDMMDYFPFSFRHPHRRRRNSDESGDENPPEEVEVYNFNPEDPVANAKFVITQRQKLLRLLILGGRKCKVGSTVMGNRSADPEKNDEFSVITTMIEQGDGVEVVNLLKDVSVKGRSPKQDGLVYGLAMCCRSENLETKSAAYNAVQDMCRTPTQLFQLIRYIENLDKDSTGWGRGLRHAITKWYNQYAENPSRLAMHVTKYWSRHDWNHRDLFRLSHIKPVNETIGFIVRYCVKDMEGAEKYYLEDGYMGREDLEKIHKYLKAVEQAKSTLDVSLAVNLMQEHRLVREQLRTELLNEREIWSAMLKDMPLMALIRNLGKMSSIQLFDSPENQDMVISKISNIEAMKKARIHPVKLLIAHHTYKQGHGGKSKLTWEANPAIVQALEKAFYASFGLVEPTNKRILIALDISSSMCITLCDLPITAREASTLLSMLTARLEPNCDIVGFHTQLIDLNLLFKNSKKTLENLVACVDRLGFDSTDCSKPMLWALENRKPYDAFIIYTDSETNSHKIPPHAALDKYREGMNIPTAKLVVVGMTTNDFSIARPNDLNMLDVIGFDPETPDIISEFLRGGFE